MNRYAWEVTSNDQACAVSGEAGADFGLSEQHSRCHFGGQYLDKEDAIDHEADVVLGDCALVRDGDRHLLEAVHIRNLVHLHENDDPCKPA